MLFFCIIPFIFIYTFVNAIKKSFFRLGPRPIIYIARPEWAPKHLDLAMTCFRQRKLPQVRSFSIENFSTGQFADGLKSKRQSVFLARARKINAFVCTPTRTRAREQGIENSILLLDWKSKFADFLS